MEGELGFGVRQEDALDGAKLSLQGVEEIEVGHALKLIHQAVEGFGLLALTLCLVEAVSDVGATEALAAKGDSTAELTGRHEVSAEVDGLGCGHVFATRAIASRGHFRWSWKGRRGNRCVRTPFLWQDWFLWSAQNEKGPRGAVLFGNFASISILLSGDNSQADLPENLCVWNEGFAGKFGAEGLTEVRPRPHHSRNKLPPPNVEAKFFARNSEHSGNTGGKLLSSLQESLVSSLFCDHSTCYEPKQYLAKQVQFKLQCREIRGNHVALLVLLVICRGPVFLIDL